LHRWGNVAVCKWAAHADNTVARTVSTGDARAEAAAKPWQHSGQKKLRVLYSLKITSPFLFLYRSCRLLRHEQNVSNKIMARDEFG